MASVSERMASVSESMAPVRESTASVRERNSGARASERVGAAARSALRWSSVTVLAALALGGCSPEARRTRDGGPGADPGNKVLVVRDEPNPRAADTTLWPGRAPAPVELLAKGVIPPPTYPAASTAPAKAGQKPIAPNVAPSEPQERTYDGGRANPRRQTDSTR